MRDNKEAASRLVAEHIANRINHFKPGPGKPFVLGLPTGSSPESVYKYLVQLHKAGKLTFKHVVTFNMDEYVALPREHPESYHSFMWKHLFSHIDIPRQNVNILNGLSSDLEAECAQYEAKISSYGGIELFLGGVGPDGHIAFNEMGSSLSSRTRVQSLAQSTINANARFFAGDMSKVPKQALTVGVGTIMEAREVIIIANGVGKARAVKEAVEGSINHVWTITALQAHPDYTLAVDEEATQDLMVKTVKVRTSTAARVTALTQRTVLQGNREATGSCEQSPPIITTSCLELPGQYLLRSTTIISNILLHVVQLVHSLRSCLCKRLVHQFNMTAARTPLQERLTIDLNHFKKHFSSVRVAGMDPRTGHPLFSSSRTSCLGGNLTWQQQDEDTGSADPLVRTSRHTVEAGRSNGELAMV